MYENPIEIFEEQPLVYATFWARLAASIIDGVIIGVVYAIISFILSGEFMNQDWEFSILRIGIGAFYMAVLNSSEKQSSWGKQAMNIKVTNMEGERISFFNALGRYFATFISAIFLAIGYLMMLWDDKKQTLHDKMARTLVVNN